ncbi:MULTISPECIES: DUF5804 family protein [Halorubrum]|jgi:hypothetical protein|uniref:Uncharacterized protein n=1 Tax=Halorubrum tropicale TaxID=1765655 RepID=A0A0M9AR86_9EURY|nr:MULTISPECIES: DUF5804 family protein [Halorubrum]KOX97227.1 hypothetical protein AMR74_07330 [Halorubrum tropicale]RLM51768.1 hypothetical protein DVK06_05045 [Halorubrum sp. Atlit-28R]TKX42536.1 hypothetical protein EXE50_13900 [Halorubrum sp. ARQ200]TKX49926.1 hypothetical protein EXE49_09005 [Halorubrum sp. ASP121]TKX60933.1 hypothetical protein EXE48_10940 [Halorubrum sp. ASP1]
MTRVCLLGDPDVELSYELLSRETARDALATYDIEEPFENSVAVDTVSLGAAVSLLNDLDWYLARFVAEALVLEPSVATDEWLSRDLAREVRDGEVPPEETDQRLKVFGLVDGRPVEPLFVRRRQGETPEYDLRDVEETVVVRVSESEFSG